MRNEDREAIAKMIGYCDDAQALMQEYGADYAQYQTRISFRYACDMCIIQIDELVSRLSDECLAATPKCRGMQSKQCGISMPMTMTMSILRSCGKP